MLEKTNTLLGGGTPPATGNDPVVNTPPADNGGTPPASNNFNWSGIITENGGFSDNWKDSLPEELKQEKCFDNIHTLPSLFKSYAAAQKMVGTNKVSIPSENSTQEEWDAFYKAAGRPDNAEAYSVEQIELPQGISLDDATVKSFRDFAFSHGMSQKAFEDAVKFDLARVSNYQQQAAREAQNEYEETVSKPLSALSKRNSISYIITFYIRNWDIVLWSCITPCSYNLSCFLRSLFVKLSIRKSQSSLIRCSIQFD